MKPNYQTIPGINETARFNTQEEFDRIDMPKSFKGKTVLDLGCNEGAFVIEALKRDAEFVTGVDVDEEWVTRAKTAISKSVKGLWNQYKWGVVYSDAYDFLRVDKHRYDYILCLSVTHLIDNPQALLYKMLDRLSDTGVLILEINRRLEKEPLNMGTEYVMNRVSVAYKGKNKDDRSVYHLAKNN